MSMFSSKDTQARRETAQLRAALEKLCIRLGLSYEYDEYLEKLEIAEYNTIQGANQKKQPITVERFEEACNNWERDYGNLESNYKLLLTHLNLELVEGKFIKKINKRKKTNG